MFVHRVLGAFEERLLPVRGWVVLVLLVGAAGKEDFAGVSEAGVSEEEVSERIWLVSIWAAFHENCY